MPTMRKAGVYRSGPREICMANGLLRRTWRIAPAAATVGMEDLSTGRQLLRSVRPEAIVEWRREVSRRRAFWAADPQLPRSEVAGKDDRHAGRLRA